MGGPRAGSGREDRGWGRWERGDLGGGRRTQVRVGLEVWA